MLNALPYTIVAADDALTWETGSLRVTTVSAGLSPGDRFCQALAKRLGVSAYTADRTWRDIASEPGSKVVVVQ